MSETQRDREMDSAIADAIDAVESIVSLTKRLKKEALSDDNEIEAAKWRALGLVWSSLLAREPFAVTTNNEEE